ncbi:MAG TPA: hypothetical protein VK449_05400, partial [Anaerolineales bacterium]|nr:hypothetical protein [Anaerolineales bacterium]
HLQETLVAAEPARPRPGFGGRWAARHAGHEQRQVRSRAWQLFGGTALAAAGWAAVLGWAVVRLPGTLPDAFSAVLQEGLRLWIWGRLAMGVAHALVISAPGPMAAGAILGGLSLALGSALLVAVTFLLVIRFSRQGVRR